HTLTARDFLPTAVIVQWLILFVLLLVLGRIAGRDHPPVDDRHLSLGRKIVAAGALLMFIAVFVPSPLVTSDGARHDCRRRRAERSGLVALPVSSAVRSAGPRPRSVIAARSGCRR